MTTQTEALKLALEALEIASDHYHTYHDGYKGSKTTQAITAIKEALAQDALQALHDENKSLRLYEKGYAEAPL